MQGQIATPYMDVPDIKLQHCLLIATPTEGRTVALHLALVSFLTGNAGSNILAAFQVPRSSIHNFTALLTHVDTDRRTDCGIVLYFGDICDW